MNSQQNALFESLECYMEEVVESFEDFVKKSLLLFSFGVCTVVVMLVYVLRMLTERGPCVNANYAGLQKSSRISTAWPIDNEKLYPILSTREVTVQHIKPKVTCTSANTLVMKSIWPSYEEQVLRNIGFSDCHKIGESIENLHTSFDNIRRQITLSSDKNRQRSITITPVRRRRDLSLPSRRPNCSLIPPLEEMWNIPRTPPVPIPFFDERQVDTGDEKQKYTGDERQMDTGDERQMYTGDERQMDTGDERQMDIGDESQGDNRDQIQFDNHKKLNIQLHHPNESKSAYKNITARQISSDTMAKGPAAKLSWTILTRDAVAFNTHINRIQCRVSESGKPLPLKPGYRQLASPARRCPSPARPPTISPNCPKPLPKRKLPQKFESFPRHGDYLRKKK